MKISITHEQYGLLGLIIRRPDMALERTLRLERMEDLGLVVLSADGHHAVTEAGVLAYATRDAAERAFYGDPAPINDTANMRHVPECPECGVRPTQAHDPMCPVDAPSYVNNAR